MRQFQLSCQQIHDLAHWQTTGLGTITAAFTIPGTYSKDAIFAAIATVTDRHDILRTSFTYMEGVYIPFQTVAPGQGMRNQCFATDQLSLEEPLSVRVAFGDTVTVTFRALTMILDVYTVQELQQEMQALLDGRTLEGGADGLLQFGSYAEWEATLIEEGNPEATVFWNGLRNQVSKETGLFLSGNLIDTPLSISGEFDGVYIAGMAGRLQVSEKALLIVLFKQSLSRYTDGKSLTIEILTDGRIYDELKMTLGPLSRLYPVNFPEGCSADPAKLAVHINSELETAANWNDYYYALPEELWPDTRLQFVFEFFEGVVNIEDDFEGRLKLRVLKTDTLWKMELIFPAGSYYTALASLLLADFKARVNDITLPVLYVNEKDKEEIQAYNDTREKFPVLTVPDMIRNVFRTQGSNIAVQGVNADMTYNQLHEQVENIASALIQDYSIMKGDIIGILIEDDMQVPAALLGVFFAGAAYVPLDQHNPGERLRSIISESKCRLIISDQVVSSEVKALCGDHLIINVEHLKEKRNTLCSLVNVDPSDTAYLIFTSGTTGTPKGCQLLHGNLMNYIHWANNYYFKKAEQGNFPLLTNLSFDLTITSIFTTLSRGRTLYCLDPELSLIEKLKYCFQSSNSIDTVKLTPTHISLLSDSVIGDSNIKCAIIGGEELRSSQVEILRSLAPGIRIYNEYGPTEATVGCVVKLIEEDEERITIGRPITNMEMLVLDAEENLLPVGVTGELYISGAGVAKGYWEQPGITAEKFKELPLGRYYRTGDLVRLLPDGDMEFYGRIDEQVKIRGNRIELGEIQGHLSQFGQFIVVVKKDTAGEKYITAYYVREEEIAVGVLKSFLLERLPDYMVPAFFIPIKEIPLTANGKLDAKRLPDPFTYHVQLKRAYVPPVSKTEKWLTVIWTRMLQVERIGVDDNFFELGGHSLSAMRVVSAIRKEMMVDLVIKDLFGKPTVKELAHLIEEKQEGLLLPEVMVVENRPAQIPLSYSQERLWFIDQLRGSTHYHMSSVFRLLGPLDVHAMELSFRDVVNRHESLRTVFKQIDGIPFQEILGRNGWRLDFHNKLTDNLDELVEQEIRQPFDLSKDHPLRVKLFRLTDNEHILVLVRHHIAADGWSGSLLVHEFEEFYRSRTGKWVQDLPVLSLQYADYAIWQRKYIVGAILEKQMAYWEEKLRDLEPLNLPLDYPRPAVQSVKGANLNFVINKKISDRLDGLAEQQGVTLFMLLLSVYKVLLYKYSGQTDICVGTTVAHRPEAELEPLIGFFVNTLALRTDLSNNPVFNDVLAEVKRTTLEGYSHIGVPFEKVVDRVEKERDKSRSSLFQTLFVLDNNKDAKIHSLGDLIVQPEQISYQTAKFELTFFAQETGAGIAISINYCSDLFTSGSIERMRGHFETLLSSVADNPDQRIGALRMLDTLEEDQLLVGFNQSVVTYPSRTVIALFEEQALLHPDVVAIRFGDVVVSYYELNERATKLGAYLRHLYALEPNSFVGIMMDTSEWSLVSILGVLKAGAAYVPIDVALPRERQDFIIRDTGIKVLIIASESLFDVVDFDVPVYSVDIQFGDLEEVYDMLPVATPADLAYVIYTSGTTGQPKGVMISNVNIVDYYFGLRQVIKDHASFGLMSALSADLGNTVLFGSLLSGGTLHLFTKQQLMNPALLHSYFESHPIDCIKIVPSHWSALELLPVRTIIFGGEALPVSVIEKIRSVNPSLTLINHYGPTETTIGKLLHVVDINRNYYTVPIGQPFSNTVIHVVDSSLSLCPVGVPGELLIGGDGVSPGYLHQAVMTEEKFIVSPFGGGAKLYRTGDLVRRLINGDIEFIGRVDDQVKVRGYRVEPGEVAQVLSDYKNIQQCMVLYKDQKLIAYIVGKFDKEEIVNYLKSRLPDYMVPAAFVALAEMPLTSNGKVNKRALPEPDALMVADHVAPRNELELKLVNIWSSLLNIERFSIYDSFFELGGHSLLAIRVLSAIRKELKVELSITDLFDHVTIAALSAFIESHDNNDLLPAIVPQERLTGIPLSYAQERLWFIDQMRGSSHYHMPSVFRLHGTLDVTALERSFRDIVDRHESLRTVFKDVDGVGYQEIMPTGGWVLDVAGTVDLNELIQSEVTRPFNLSGDYMMRARLVKIKEDEHVLILIRHHIASDGWSVSLIIHEFITLYRFYTENRFPELPVLPLQYADYAIWQRTYLTGEVLEQQLSYWEQKLKDIEPLHLPADYPRPAMQSTKGARLNFVIDKEISQRLEALAEQEGVTLFMLLLTIYKVLLYKYSNQTDIAVGTTVAHRPQQELEQLVGFFVNTLVLRSDLSGDPVFRELLLQVKCTTLEGYERLSVPFEKVVDKVEKERDKSRSSLFQALFVLNNNEEVEIQDLGRLVIKPEPLSYEIAKFDLTFFAQETEAGTAISINYSSDLFAPETILRMKGHFEQLVSSVVNNADQHIGELRMLSTQEEDQLLIGFNQSFTDYQPCNLIELFEEQALLHPDVVAVKFGEIELSYRELNEKATRLGYYLRHTFNLQPNDLAGVMMDTSEWSLVSILGVLKAGAAYVPIDLTLPKERQDFIIRDTGIKVLIISSESLFDVIDFNVPVFSIDIQFADMAASTYLTPVNGELAYVIYTSGTTGQPKGVMITGANIVDYYFGLRRFIRDSNSFGLMSSLSADLGNTVLFGSLLSGGTLHLFAKQQLMNPALLHSYFASHPIDCIKIVPSHWNALETLLPAKTIIFGGESLQVSVIEKIKSVNPLLTVINHYGPTETTIGKLLHVVDFNKSYYTVPIGQPFSNTVIYVVNNSLSLCPIGVPGELLIGGDGVSPGYLHQTLMTEERFVDNPFGSSCRLYRTGDLVRRLANGDIEFIGRADDQVKIRGYRVELGEIAKVLANFESIQQCAVIYKNQRLVAYLVGEFEKETILNYLKSRLPDYMIPSVFVALPEMPLMVNGKVNKKSLPEPDALVITNYIAPRNQMEEDLAEIWASLLNAEKVSISDNFFELGGDSIIVIQVVSRAKRKGYHVQVQDLFDYQTIAELSALILRNNEGSIVAEQGQLTGESPLLPIQHWFFEKDNYPVNHFNQAVLLQLDKKVSEDTLSSVVKTIVARHDILRCYYTYKNEHWLQNYGDKEGELEIINAASGEITAVCQQYQESMNIQEGILNKFVLIKTPGEEAYNRFFMVVHHLAVDGISWRILIDEISSLLTDNTALGLKTSSYRNWADALTELAVTERITSQQPYWEKIVAAFEPVPAELSIQESTRKELATVEAHLSSELTQSLLKEVNTAYNTEINDLLLCSLAMTIREWSSNENVVIGLEGHGREELFPQLDITGTVGWFTSKYPVLLQLEKDMKEGSALKSVKEQLRNIPDKGIGFGCLKYLHPVKELSGDCWDIVFNYLGQQDNVVNANEWFKGAPEYPGDHISREYPIRDKFVIRAVVTGNALHISFSYSSKHYTSERVQSLADNYIHHLTALINHCVVKEDRDVTPADFGLNGKLDYRELDALLGKGELEDEDGVMKF